jgi:putative drug exporter of the RND superfamily
MRGAGSAMGAPPACVWPFLCGRPGAGKRDTAGPVTFLAGLPGVASVISPFAAGPFAAGAARQVSPDGRIAYGVIRFDGSGDAIPGPAIQRVIAQAQRAAGPGFAVQLGGAPVQKVENPKFGKSEALGILAAVLILLLAFGSVIAMVLPIVTAIVAVATSFGLLDLLSHGLTVPSFAPELAALVGLGVGIDYALFVVTTYRGARAAGSAPEDAVVTAMATSGRAVVFAGSTVVLSLLGLFLLGLPFIYGAALGAVIAVLLVMSASVTLLPAALGFAGANIDRLRIGRRSPRKPGQVSAGGFWWAWSRRVQRYPWLAGGAAIAVLLVLTLPFLSLRLAFTDAGTNPASYTSRQAYDLLAKGFGPGTNGPLVVALSLPGPAGQATVTSLRTDLASQPDVAYVSPPQYSVNRDAAVLTVANALAKTGRIITSAAAIMICVFAAFVLGDLRVLRVIGLGMAVAVLLDATGVRMVATPAVLQLMGRANWWFPPALERAVPDFLAEIQPDQVNTDRADYLTTKGTA